MNYFVDPACGDDSQAGTSADEAWRTFAPVNALVLGPGDRVDVCAAGPFDGSLIINGHGSTDAPIDIHFAPGRYDWHPEHAIRRQYYISNTNGDAEGLKAVALLLEGARHVNVTGTDARIVFRGKTIEVCIDGCEGINITGLTFDYERPTVSEFRVLSATPGEALIEIHRDSDYEIRNGQIVWLGEGWSETTGLAQDLSGRIYLANSAQHTVQVTEGLQEAVDRYAGVTDTSGLKNEQRLTSHLLEAKIVS